MIEITVNGTKTQLESAMSLPDFLLAHGYYGKHVAIAVNKVFVAKQEREKVMLDSGDDLEIVAPMQGG